MRPVLIAGMLTLGGAVALAPLARADGCDLPGAFAQLSELLELHERFVGCRPSAGECASSCPARDGFAELDPDTCPTGGLEGDFACYCITETSEPEPPPEGASYLGCRPSPGECAMSCPTRDIYAVVDPSLCDPGDPFSPDGGVACYCL